MDRYIERDIDRVYLYTEKGFPDGSVVKNLPANSGDTADTGFISGLGKSPRGGNGNPLQYSFQEDPIDRGDWWATVPGIAESDTTEHLSMHAYTEKDWGGGSSYFKKLAQEIVRAGRSQVCRTDRTAGWKFS